MKKPARKSGKNAASAAASAAHGWDWVTVVEGIARATAVIAQSELGVVFSGPSEAAALLNSCASTVRRAVCMACMQNKCCCGQS